MIFKISAAFLRQVRHWRTPEHVPHFASFPEFEDFVLFMIFAAVSATSQQTTRAEVSRILSSGISVRSSQYKVLLEYRCKKTSISSFVSGFAKW